LRPHWAAWCASHCVWRRFGLIGSCQRLFDGGAWKGLVSALPGRGVKAGAIRRPLAE
jgi:hypothetical protein